jgi:DNA-binding MarR family transcriptional regulator
MDRLGGSERIAIARLRAMLELLPAALDRQLVDTGLTAFEFVLLEALHDADFQRLRLTALASQTNATLPRLSRVVTGLEAKGLVTRVPCEEDGRATNAVLTEAGERLYAQGRPLYDEAVRTTVLSGLDSKGVDQLAELSYSILTQLDPERRLAVTADCPADPPLRALPA